MTKIAILGGGSCGTALAVAFARSRQPHQISLWVHGADVLQALRSARENSVYLPGIRVPERHSAHRRHERSANRRRHRPRSHAFGARSRNLHSRPALPGPRMIFVSATKGLEHDSLQRMTEVIADVTRARFTPRLAALSGPSFALEVARGDPTAVVIASRQPEIATAVQEEFSGPTLRLYTNDDIVGVEVGGAVKNVIAIAAGACAGLGFGANTIAALVTRGLAEMTRLAVALGGRRDTLAGLAGLGDLVLTAPARSAAIARWASSWARAAASPTSWRACAWWPRASAPRPPCFRWPASTAWKCLSPSRWTPFCTTAAPRATPSAN